MGWLIKGEITIEVNYLDEPEIPIATIGNENRGVFRTFVLEIRISIFRIFPRVDEIDEEREWDVIHQTNA